MRRSVLVCAFVALSLSACDSPTKLAEDDVRASLKDPDSAKFRGVVKFSTGAVCGEVNAKNAMGGYVGFTPFVVSRHGQVEFDPGESTRLDDGAKAKAEAKQRYFQLLYETECRALPK